MKKPLNILIVEDSEDDALLLLHELRKGGFELSSHRVDNRAEMASALDAAGWDLIIADYMMPQFSAPAALELAKEYELDLPFIIVSGKIGEETAVEALKAGAHDFIVKGNLARLVPAIERELREAKVRQERRKADEAVRKLSSAVEQAADAVIITNRDGIIEYVNSAFERLSGYQADEVVGMSPALLRSGCHSAEFYRELWQTITGGGVYRNELINRRRNGDIYYQEEIITPIRDGKGAISHFVSTGRDITERKRNENKIALQIQRLAALREIDKTITTSLDLNLTLGLILRRAAEQLRIDAALVLHREHSHEDFITIAQHGFLQLDNDAVKFSPYKGLPSVACAEQRIFFIADLAESKLSDPRKEMLVEHEGMVSYFCAPLLNKGIVDGVLEIYHRSTLKPDTEWLQFLETLAEQAAIAIGNSKLFNELQQSNAELARAYETTLEGWSKALDLRDQETEGHTQRVTELTIRLARAMGYPETDLIHVRRGALLHDIGKMGIPDSILLKPDKLSAEEWEVMRRHPLYAHDLLSPITHLHSALEIPYYHHEKWDGSGYPHGLQGEEIPLAARIFAVIDVWDALCSDRPYRKGWPKEKARDLIRNDAGSHFDPKVVAAFLELGL